MPFRVVSRDCSLAALTRLLFLCRLLPWCSTHSPDLWPGHTPHSWDRDCSLRPGLEPGTGGCPPERVPGDTEQTRVCMKESCLYEGRVACGFSTWCNKMLFMGSCEGNRGISCSKVVFWSTTATRWSSPRSEHAKIQKKKKMLNCLVFSFIFLPLTPFLTCSEVKQRPLVAHLRHSQLGVCYTLSHQQGRSGDAVLHQGMVPHESQHLVWKVQGRLEAFSFQVVVQTL